MDWFVTGNEKNVQDKIILDIKTIKKFTSDKFNAIIIHLVLFKICNK